MKKIHGRAPHRPKRKGGLTEKRVWGTAKMQREKNVPRVRKFEMRTLGTAGNIRKRLGKT